MDSPVISAVVLRKREAMVQFTECILMLFVAGSVDMKVSPYQLIPH